jgi:hypothetical protein
MTEFDLHPDCAHCDALCCVLLAFDASSAFAVDKPACTACHHLSDANQCKIHATREIEGFRGCTVFDCQGAGQRVTQQVFKDRSWRDDHAQLPAMENAFRAMRRLHEAVALLQAAAILPLPPPQEHTRTALLSALDASRDWTEADLIALEAGPDLKAVASFFVSLRSLDGLTLPRR